MKFQIFIAAATLALESVLAHPTIHHAHHLRLRDLLTKKSAEDTDVSGVDFSKDIDWDDKDWDCIFGKKKNCDPTKPKTGQKNKAAAVAPQPAKSDTEATLSDNNEVKTTDTTKTVEEKFSDDTKPSGSSGKCANVANGSGKVKRATKQQDNWQGDYINNIKGEPDCKSSGDYSMTFVNNRGQKKTFWLWNNYAKDGVRNGMNTEPDQTFDLEDGESATFTFKPNSQVGFSEACGRATESGNVPNCNIGEANFRDGNIIGGSDGGSFYDVSMVTYNDIKSDGGNPVNVPMTISADGYSTSTNEECSYIYAKQNSAGGTCDNGPHDARPFHPKAVFG